MKKLLMLAVLAGAAWAQDSLTLPEAEALAVKNNPDVSAALLFAAAANQVTIETKAADYPTAYASVTGAGAIHSSNLSAGGLTNSSVNNRVGSGFTATQLITDFGRTRNLTASAQLHAQAREQDAEARRADVLLQVDRAYFQALRANEVLTVAQQTVKSRQLVADQVQALANSKLKSGLDVSFANVSLSQAKLLLVNAESDLKAGYAQLSQALGYREPHTFTLTDPGMPAAPPTDAAPLLQASLANRPEIRSAKADYEGAQRFTAAEHDLRKPTISAIGTAGVTPVHDDALRGRYAAAGVNLNIPIFNGHLFSARENEAALRAQRAEQTLRSVENAVTHDVQVAFLNADTAWRRVALTGELLANANEALNLAQARYDLGLSSIVELSQAQLNQTQAQIDGASARFDYDLQRSVLDYQEGLKR
jgi:outer membrane protein